MIKLFTGLIILGLLLTGCKGSEIKGGMDIMTDQGTGCQYLKNPNYGDGGIVPRMGRDGKQICVEVVDPE